MQFFVVYIREAHALESRVVPGSRGIPAVEEPISIKERQEVAHQCRVDMSLDQLQMLVDGLDNAVERAYVAHPDRLYLVGKDGRIAYHGLEGPAGLRPESLAWAIEEELDSNP